MTGTVVVLAGGGDTGRVVAHHLAQQFAVSGFIVEDGVSRATLLRNRAKRIGRRAALGQALFMASVVPALRATSRARIAEIKAAHGMDDSPFPGTIRVVSANAPATIALLGKLEPTVVVVAGTRILSKGLLGSVPATFINWHAGITPLYRGVHGGYWSLVQGRADECGVTVHLVDAGIDTGGVLAQAQIHPTARDNFVTYPYLQLAAALPLLAGAVRAALERSVVPIEPRQGTSRLWYHPTLAQYVWHRLTRGVR